MRIGLIGCTYHWQVYASALRNVDGAEVVAVAPGCAAEDPASFDTAPGVTAATRRFDDPHALLDKAKPDVVQISTAFEKIPEWAIAAAECGIPMVTEKPIAMDLETLTRLRDAALATNTPIYAVQGMHGHAAFTAAREAVADGRIGTPYASYHQKSYRWGSRPEHWRRRETFPGLVPWVGIHALGWMLWVLGDVFDEVMGYEGCEGHPDYPACATQAGLVFRMKNGGYALLSVDYLRPEGAPTHGDERMRVAGSDGVVEVFAVENRATLVTREREPHEIVPSAPPLDGVTQFVRSLRGECAPPASTHEVLRVTEIALLAQEAISCGKPRSLAKSVLGGPPDHRAGG